MTPATHLIQLGDLAIDVTQKDIKNIHLSVYPPHGSVRMSAPQNANPETLRIYAISKLSWIKQQQQKLQTQTREAPKSYLNRESHTVWGKRYLLTIIEQAAPPKVTLTPTAMTLQIRPGATPSKKQAVLEQFYRQLLNNAIPPLIQKWENRMEVSVQGVTIRKMKTKWGSCSPNRGTIRINLDLAKKPAKFLEYVIVHEMTHLLEPTHNHKFIHWMDTFLPQWKSYRQDLNQLPTTYQKSGLNRNDDIWKADQTISNESLNK